MSVMTISSEKTTEPMKMAFGMWTRVGDPHGKGHILSDDVGFFPQAAECCFQWP